MAFIVSNLDVFGFVLLVIESGETTSDCHVTSEFNTSQCIFYPVKEEERELLLGTAQTNSDLTTGTSTDAMQTEHQATECNLGESLSFPVIIPSFFMKVDRKTTILMLNLFTADEGSHSDYQEMRVRGLLSEPVVSDFQDGQGLFSVFKWPIFVASWLTCWSYWWEIVIILNIIIDLPAEVEHPPDIQEFLLQSSDEEDVGGFELSDPQLDSEVEVMAFFYKNQTDSTSQPDGRSQ